MSLIYFDENKNKFPLNFFQYMTAEPSDSHATLKKMDVGETRFCIMDGESVQREPNDYVYTDWASANDLFLVMIVDLSVFSILTDGEGLTLAESSRTSELPQQNAIYVTSPRSITDGIGILLKCPSFYTGTKKLYYYKYGFLITYLGSNNQ